MLIDFSPSGANEHLLLIVLSWPRSLTNEQTVIITLWPVTFDAMVGAGALGAAVTHAGYTFISTWTICLGQYRRPAVTNQLGGIVGIGTGSVARTPHASSWVSPQAAHLTSYTTLQSTGLI